MAITTTTTLDDSVKAKYMSDYLIAAHGAAVWSQYVSWKEPIPDTGGGASSFNWPVYHEMDVAITALTEDSDITPVAVSDSNVSVTPTEYGNAVCITHKVRFQARADVRKALAELVGQNQAKSIDRLIRNGVVGGSWYWRPNNNTAITGLDTTNDKVTYDFLSQLKALAGGAFIEPIDGRYHLLIVHPAMAADLRDLDEWRAVGAYSVPEKLYTAEVGEIAGFRVVEHPWGKLYLSGGQTAQAATALTSAVAADATSCTVDDATGLVAGDFITVGTLESAAAEQVQITGVSGSDLTIRGIGASIGTFGFKNAHAAGIAVTEAANVGALPVIGKNSVIGTYGASWGQFGQPTTKEGLDILDRFLYLGYENCSSKTLSEQRERLNPIGHGYPRQAARACSRRD